MVNHVNATSLISIADAYIKASIPGSSVTGAYMTIKNASDKEITLLKVTSEISDRVEMHEHTMLNGMMRMREVDKITIAANNQVVLKPMGLHIMVFDLKQQISEKELIPVTLYFSNKTKLNIQLPVYQYK